MQWLKEHFGWLVLIVIAAFGGRIGSAITNVIGAYTGIGAYLKARRDKYVQELENECTELRNANNQLLLDLESVIRQKDLRDDINKQDRETIRQLLQTCDEHICYDQRGQTTRRGVDYSHITSSHLLKRLLP